MQEHSRLVALDTKFRLIGGAHCGSSWLERYSRLKFNAPEWMGVSPTLAPKIHGLNISLLPLEDVEFCSYGLSS